jgi:hypothetical protein
LPPIVRGSSPLRAGRSRRSYGKGSFARPEEEGTEERFPQHSAATPLPEFSAHACLEINR